MSRDAMNGVTLSVVVPVYGCAPCLDVLYHRVFAALDQLQVTTELVLVDDCAPDDAWPIIARLAQADPRVRGVRLSRNFGQHAAITAGLDQARGTWCIVMDCDLQDPPEDIPRFYQRALEGFDVVLGKRKGMQASGFRRWASKTFFGWMSPFATETRDGRFGTFSILSRRVVNAFLAMQDRDRHYLFILRWLGFSTAVIEYDHGERHAGQSSYTLAKLIRHALSAVAFQSVALLEAMVVCGFGMGILGLLLAGALVLQYFVSVDPVPGWSSLAVLILVTSGILVWSVFSVEIE